jgi:hypothetical protein
MSEWISIYDSVPEIDQRFHAYHYSGPHWDHGAFVGSGWDEKSIAESLKVRGYSHWMPLPSPPEDV